METRSCLSRYDPASGHYTVWATSQTPHYMRRWLAKYLLFEAEHKIRVISPDVGGGFGLKVHVCEAAVVVWASKLVRRPVKWTASSRSSGTIQILWPPLPTALRTSTSTPSANR